MQRSKLNYIYFLISIIDLNISYCICLDNNVIDVIVNKTPDIKVLNISGLTYQVTDNNFDMLSKLNNLENFDCSKCTEITDVSLLKLDQSSSFKLLILNMSCMLKITSKSINCIIEKHCNSLVELNISLLKQKEIDNSAIKNLYKCSKLINLNISGSNFEDISTIKSLKNLISLNLSNINSVDNYNAIDFISNHKLKVLRMSNCVSLTNDFLEHILNLSTTNLKLIELNRTPNLNDKLMMNIMEKFHPNLRIIRSSNLVWNNKNIGLTIPLKPIEFEKPFLKGMKKPTKKKQNDKNPISMLNKFNEENEPKYLLDYYEI